MIYIKTDEEIEKLRSSCLLVSKTLAMLAPLVQPGVSTKYLDSLAEEFIRDNGAETPCKGYSVCHVYVGKRRSCTRYSFG